MYQRSFLLLCLLSLLACQSAYYSAMETVGQHKRDIMVDRVEDAQDAQQQAQQEFKSALEQFSELIAFDGGDLAEQYELTNDHFEASKEAAQEVSDRIEGVEDVAEALFAEWRDEINRYSSAKLKRQSQSKLSKTEQHYQSLIKSMHRAEKKMAPVLAALKDNSLYLKHNLNARAIGTLEGEYQSIKRDVQSLLAEMNKAIAQSQQFIDLLEPGS
ncbi:DNA repair protein [Thalassotalea sp. 42_200_T64]|nr:DNA repair protein [Thalassotalea sp. 42_200_T64]